MGETRNRDAGNKEQQEVVKHQGSNTSYRQEGPYCIAQQFASRRLP